MEERAVIGNMLYNTTSYQGEKYVTFISQCMIHEVPSKTIWHGRPYFGSLNFPGARFGLALNYANISLQAPNSGASRYLKVPHKKVF